MSSAQDWSKVDLNLVDREWEEADDPRDRGNSFEALKEIESRKMRDMPQFDEKNPQQYLKCDLIEFASITY